MTTLRIILGIPLFLMGIALSLPVALLALPLLLVTLLVRAIVYLIEPRFVAWNDIIEFDPAIGWKPKKNLDAYYLTLAEDGIFHTTTDAQGWPGKATLSESEVVVIGDSFSFGYGVDIADTFAAIDSGARIKSIGSPGYNMVQELLLMKQLSPELCGKLVVWFICVENDLIDNLSPHTFHYRTPFVAKQRDAGGWNIVTRHLSPTKWHYMHHSNKNFPYQGGYLKVLAKLCGPNGLSRRAYSACEFLIKEGHDVCHRAGANLVVMTIPNANQLTPHGRDYFISCGADAGTFDPAFPDKQIGEICGRLGVGFLAARTFLDEGDYKELDPHWNKRGHRRVSRALRDLYREYAIPRGQEAREIAFGKPEFVEAIGLRRK